MTDVVPFLAGLEGGKLKNSNSDKVVQLYSLLWIRGKSTIDFKSILQYDFEQFVIPLCSSFSQLMFEYQNEVLEFCADKDVGRSRLTLYPMTPYQVSAMVFMLKNLLSWDNWLFSQIYVGAGSYDERFFQVLPSCLKRCDSVFIHFFDDVWNYEILKVVPFLRIVSVGVRYSNFGVVADYIGKAISITSECKLQHLTYYIYVIISDGIVEFPKDIINGILECSHVLETVTVSFKNLLPENIKWIDQSHVMANDVNKRISDGLMGKLHHFDINLPVTNAL